MADDAKGFWQSAPGLLTGAAAVIASVTGLIVALAPKSASTPVPHPVEIAPAPAPGPAPAIQTPSPQVRQPQQETPPAAMGALEFGVGYEGNDLHPKGWLTMGSAQACSKRCYETLPCKAMTYVKSNRSCWLKSAAGNRIESSDEVSAVKR